MLLFLTACSAPPPAPPADEGPAAALPPESFVLVGRAAHEGLLVPSLPDGRALLGPACTTVNARLRGSGPPCLAERWRSGEREALFLVAHPAARLIWTDGPTVAARTSWTALGATLSYCLEDPLMVPPARDPSGTRRFTGAEWELHLSGDNRCALGGVLGLSVTRDQADWSALTVEGLPWREGGRQRAEATAVRLLTPR